MGEKVILKKSEDNNKVMKNEITQHAKIERKLGRIKSGNLGHQVNSDSDLVCFIL